MNAFYIQDRGALLLFLAGKICFRGFSIINLSVKRHFFSERPQQSKSLRYTLTEEAKDLNLEENIENNNLNVINIRPLPISLIIYLPATTCYSVCPYTVRSLL